MIIIDLNIKTSPCLRVLNYKTVLEFPSSVEFTRTLSRGYNDRVGIKGH